MNDVTTGDIEIQRQDHYHLIYRRGKIRMAEGGGRQCTRRRVTNEAKLRAAASRIPHLRAVAGSTLTRRNAFAPNTNESLTLGSSLSVLWWDSLLERDLLWSRLSANRKYSFSAPICEQKEQGSLSLHYPGTSKIYKMYNFHRRSVFDRCKSLV